MHSQVGGHWTDDRWTGSYLETVKIFVDSDCDNGGREGESLAKEAMPMQLSAAALIAAALNISQLQHVLALNISR